MSGARKKPKRRGSKPFLTVKPDAAPLFWMILEFPGGTRVHLGPYHDNNHALKHARQWLRNESSPVRCYLAMATEMVRNLDL